MVKESGKEVSSEFEIKKSEYEHETELALWLRLNRSVNNLSDAVNEKDREAIKQHLLKVLEITVSWLKYNY